MGSITKLALKLTYFTWTSFDNYHQFLTKSKRCNNNYSKCLQFEACHYVMLVDTSPSYHRILKCRKPVYGDSVLHKYMHLHVNYSRKTVGTGVSLKSHWGRVTQICVSKLTITGSDNGLSPGRHQAIIWTNAGILLIGPLVTNFCEILIGIHIFSFKKMHLKMSSA